MSQVGVRRWLRHRFVVKVLQLINVNGKPDKAIIQYGSRPPMVVAVSDLSKKGPI